MNIYLQCFTQHTSNSIAELVAVPGELLLNTGIAGVAQTSAGGKIAKRYFTDVQSFARGLAKTRLNELEINYEVENVKIGHFSIQYITALFRPSSLSDLWYPSSEFDTSDCESGNREMNAFKQEECLKRLGISREPSSLEVVISVDPIVERGELVNRITDSICRNVGRSHAHLGTFGCADFFEQKIFVRLESNLLMLDEFRAMSRLLPTSYADFGTSFEDIHEVMFGASGACRVIASQLGNRCRISQCSDPSVFTVLQICLAEGRRTLRNQIQDCLLPTVPD